MRLDTQRLQTLDQIREFLADSDRSTCSRRPGRGLRVRGRDPGTGTPAKGRPTRASIPGQGGRPSRAQVTRLLRQHRTTGAIADRRGPRRPFPRRYTKADIGLLAEVAPSTAPSPVPPPASSASGPCTCSGTTASSTSPPSPTDISTTCATRPAIGAAAGRCPRRPAPCTSPSASGAGPGPPDNPDLRVDTVHQGDLDGIKGLYHLNLVDEVTHSSSAHSSASRRPVAPVLEALLRAPFTVRGFHADNGTEFINRKVAALLQALHIDEFTKSRPRRSNDNALVESKNGSVIRKHLGYGHIPSRYAERVNAFTQQVLSPYLNFHRPCLFPVEVVDAKGRVRKRYPHANVMTPYEKLKSLPNAADCLKPGSTSSTPSPPS